MLVDANLLLYAVDARSPHHSRAARWLQEILNADRRVGLPWQTIGAFLRISTHPRASANPLSPADAWAYVESWLAAGPVWIPPATERTAAVLGRLVARHQISANLIPDAQLAALAIEHGLVVCSADTDFGRFDELRWRNPLRD
ncbi:MAG: TA system VapC family ribonuclease toxin [Acidimicrobiales bacterium]